MTSFCDGLRYILVIKLLRNIFLNFFILHKINKTQKKKILVLKNPQKNKYIKIFKDEKNYLGI